MRSVESHSRVIIMATTPVRNTSPVSPSESVEERFRRLETQWSAETRVLSDPGKIMSHPAMRAIIALGGGVVPIILRDLQAKPSPIVWALPEITGENPAPATIEGGFRKWDIVAETEAWLQWGRNKGLV
jgi:hypothetical protein